MPTVTLSDQCDCMLKQLVTDPFEQTRESLIEDLIKAELIRRQGGKPELPAHKSEDVMRIDPYADVSLAFSRVQTAVIDGEPVRNANWNSLMNAIHCRALRAAGSFVELARVSSARLRDGKYQADGFKFLKDCGFSIQGVDSNLAWRHTLQIAKSYEIFVSVSFRWNEKGAHPGRRALIEWNPDQT